MRNTSTLKPYRRLRRNVVVTLEYRCRPTNPNDDPEHDWLEGYWTGEIDTWGKLTIQVVCTSSVPFPVYLFPDEIISIDAPCLWCNEDILEDDYLPYCSRECAMSAEMDNVQ